MYISEERGRLHSNRLSIFQRQRGARRIDNGVFHLSMELIV